MIISTIQRKRELFHLEHQIKQVYHHAQRPEALPPVLRQSLESRTTGQDATVSASQTAVTAGTGHPDVPKYVRLLSDLEIAEDEAALKELFAGVPRVSPTPLFIRRTRNRLLKQVRVRTAA